MSENFPPETNAAASRVFERACYWVRWGHEVSVITSAPNFPDGKIFPGYRNRWRQVEDMGGIRVVRMKTFMAPNEGVLARTLDFLSLMATGFAGGLVERRPDIVVATSPQLFVAVAGWGLAAVRRRPFVFELGDLWPASIAAVGALAPGLALRLVEKLELFLYRRAACVVALTRAFKDDVVRRGIAADKIAVVINGVDLPRYAPRPRDQGLAAEWGLTGKFVVGYVGTLGMAHGLANLLVAAARLAERQDLCFLLVGPGAERAGLMAEAVRRGLRNVVFAPPQPKETMPRVWSLCDVALVHLKDSAVFADVIPSKMFEAMAMGLPLLLASPRGEAAAIVEGEGAGLWVPAGDARALAGAARRLADDPGLLRRLAAASLGAAPRYSRERQARDMARVLERAAAAAAGDARRG
ncbi:MAG: glycosyltransferase family 4 protein [Pseudomonadota bacterium]